MVLLGFSLILLLRGFWETMKRALEDTRFNDSSIPLILNMISKWLIMCCYDGEPLTLEVMKHWNSECFFCFKSADFIN